MANALATNHNTPTSWWPFPHNQTLFLFCSVLVQILHTSPLRMSIGCKCVCMHHFFFTWLLQSEVFVEAGWARLKSLEQKAALMFCPLFPLQSVGLENKESTDRSKRFPTQTHNLRLGHTHTATHPQINLLVFWWPALAPVPHPDPCWYLRTLQVCSGHNAERPCGVFLQFTVNQKMHFVTLLINA